jgi:hypothetical protein
MGSYQALLLDTAQALDEEKSHSHQTETEILTKTSPLASLKRFDGVEFALAVPLDEKAEVGCWGGENVEQVAAWARDAWQRLAQVGEQLHAGELEQMIGLGLQRHVGVGGHKEKGVLCAGFRRTLTPDAVDQTMKQVFSKWVS